MSDSERTDTADGLEVSEWENVITAEAPEVITVESSAQVRDGLLRVTAKQYSQAVGVRWDKAAGFLFWADGKFGKSHRLTIPEWKQVHEVFKAQVVR